MSNYAQQTGHPYDLIKGLEIVTSLFTEYVKKGIRIYSDDSWTYTRCQEKLVPPENQLPPIIGGFAKAGALDIFSHFFWNEYGISLSVGAVRRFQTGIESLLSWCY